MKKITFYINYFYSKLRANLLYKLLGVVYPAKILKGDKIRCHGIGYPMWKGKEFTCTLDFKDGTIGIDNIIRVNEKDFRVV